MWSDISVLGSGLASIIPQPSPREPFPEVFLCGIARKHGPRIHELAQSPICRHARRPSPWPRQDRQSRFVVIALPAERPAAPDTQFAVRRSRASAAHNPLHRIRGRLAPGCAAGDSAPLGPLPPLRVHGRLALLAVRPATAPHLAHRHGFGYTGGSRSWLCGRRQRPTWPTATASGTRAARSRLCGRRQRPQAQSPLWRYCWSIFLT